MNVCVNKVTSCKYTRGYMSSWRGLMERPDGREVDMSVVALKAETEEVASYDENAELCKIRILKEDVVLNTIKFDDYIKFIIHYEYDNKVYKWELTNEEYSSLREEECLPSIFDLLEVAFPEDGAEVLRKEVLNCLRRCLILIYEKAKQGWLV